MVSSGMLQTDVVDEDDWEKKFFCLILDLDLGFLLLKIVLQPRMLNDINGFYHAFGTAHSMKVAFGDPKFDIHWIRTGKVDSAVWHNLCDCVLVLIVSIHNDDLFR